MKPILALLVGLLLLAARPSSGGEFNEILSVGDAAPAWTKLPGTDGQEHSLADLEGKPVVVVVFTCGSCPVAADYEGRIGDLIKAHAGADGKVAVVPICVNNVAGDDLEALKKRVADRKLPFQYLHDKTQKIAKDYGANTTPEFFVLNKDRKVVYMGALDDSTAPDKVKARYVDDAIAAALAGKPPETKEIIARGCRIRYARERRGS